MTRQRNGAWQNALLPCTRGPLRFKDLLTKQARLEATSSVLDLKASFVIRYRRLSDRAYYLEVVVVVVLSIIAAVRY